MAMGQEMGGVGARLQVAGWPVEQGRYCAGMRPGWEMGERG